MVIASYGQNCADPANIYQFSYNGKNYEIVKELKSWDEAANCAVERGGHLVHIDNQDEQDNIYNAIINGAGISNTYTSVSDGGGVAYVWIGATDVNSEGTWIWDGDNDHIGTNFWNGQGNAGSGGGSAVNGVYVNWGGSSSGTPNEPDNYLSRQDGAAIALANWPYGIAGEWNDIDMQNTLYYIIEYESSNSIGFNGNNINNSNIILYPNPSKNKVNVKTHNINQPITSIKIYNQLGAILFEQTGLRTFDKSINLGNMESGIYFITIIFEKGVTVNKKIIIK